ncbi:hypothetical protein EXIGLDRAFT_769189, partial [Exidia glandulosa HHB12029]
MHEGREFQDDVFATPAGGGDSSSTTRATTTKVERRRSFSASLKKVVENAAARIPGTPQRQAARHARAMSESSATTRPRVFAAASDSALPRMNHNGEHKTAHQFQSPATDYDVPKPLQQGTQMLKVSAKK